MTTTTHSKQTYRFDIPFEQTVVRDGSVLLELERLPGESEASLRLRALKHAKALIEEDLPETYDDYVAHYSVDEQEPEFDARGLEMTELDENGEEVS